MAHILQEKLNEAVMVMNKSLQVSCTRCHEGIEATNTISGSQHPEYERRACGSDVQKLPIKRAVSPRRFFLPSICWNEYILIILTATESLKEPL